MPSFNTFRKINYNDPQYQMAMRDRMNKADNRAVKSGRDITGKFTQAEAGRIRALDEFGTANRARKDALRFRYGLHKDKKDMAWDQIRDARRGRKLGLAINIGQMGLNAYDQIQQGKLAAKQRELIQAQIDAHNRANPKPRSKAFIPGFTLGKYGRRF